MVSESRVGVEGWCAGLFGSNDGKRADLGLSCSDGMKVREPEGCGQQRCAKERVAAMKDRWEEKNPRPKEERQTGSIAKSRC